MVAISARVSVVLVGIGGYGEAYLSALLDSFEPGEFSIAGAVEPAPERCGRLADLRALDVPVYGALGEFYAERSADLAVISSPIHYHCPQTCTALENGSHVLCEKPLGATIQGALRMIAARQEAGRFVAIGYQWSFSRAIQELKRDIRGGLFGAPRRLSTLVLWPRRHSYYRRNNWAGRIRDDEGRWILDSPVNNATAHFLHNMFYCLGEEWNTSAAPPEVTGELYRANDIENYDTAALRCHTAGGVEVLYFSSHAVSELLGPVLRYEFEDAAVTMKGMGGELTARTADGSEKSYGTPCNAPDEKLRQCMEAARDDGGVACPIEAAAAQTLCMNGLQESAGTITDFPEAMRRTEGEAGDEITWAEGLYEALTECWEAGALPSEMGFEWASPGRAVDLSGYAAFPADKG